MNRLEFKILPPVLQPAEPIRICGNLPELGSWLPADALTLDWQEPWHTATLDIPTGFRIEYKILRDDWPNEEVSAFNNILDNHTLIPHQNQIRQHVVANWKDRIPGELTRTTVGSALLGDEVELLVWLPPSYRSSDRRFPVLVLHDGNHLFNPSTCGSSLIDWAVDEWVTRLAMEGAFPEAIVVGICESEGMVNEDLSHRDRELSPSLDGETYARFVIEELVPFLDEHYRTLGTPESRILGGASLGALNALHTAITYPGTFSKYLCLSTAFEDVSGAPPEASAMLQRLESLDRLPDDTRIYFDYGTLGLDECYDPYHVELGGILREKGWKEGDSFAVRRVPGSSHDDLSWRQRLPDALQFLAG